MKLITDPAIAALDLSPRECVDWVRESFSLKKEAQLPAKTSLHPQGSDFFNTMPCLLPAGYNRFGVKEVSRIEGAVPALCAYILLYDSATGELLAMLDGDRITTMRTGAVATLAAQTLRRTDREATYGFIGLGNTARATLLCLLDAEPSVMHHITLLRYKDQTESFRRRFDAFRNVTFTESDTPESVISGSDVVFSCVTNADNLLCPDDTKFQPGCLVVPIHTKGFQNCDLSFDRVVADDRAHVCGFRYFDRFRRFAELDDVLAGRAEGRTSNTERILSYNIGLGLHDVLFATRIYERLADTASEFSWPKANQKFWI